MTDDEREARQHQFTAMKTALDALDKGGLRSILVGGSEVVIAIEGRDADPEVVDALKRMVQKRIDALRRELGE